MKTKIQNLREQIENAYQQKDEQMFNQHMGSMKVALRGYCKLKDFEVNKDE